MNWIVLKALHKLYETRRIKKTISLSSDPYFQMFLQTGEVYEVGKFYNSTDKYEGLYREKHCNKYGIYKDFLERLELDKKRFEEDDINKLIELEKKVNNDTLVPSRSELIKAQESVRGFSLMFFKNDKYLDKKDSLIDAINLILNIKLVSNKDQQYLYVLQCDDPKLIVLCENLDFLRKDKLPRENKYELWYAGGRNVPKLAYIPEIRRGLPIYYSADWDKDGLEIFELAKKHIPDLELLHPNGQSKSITSTEHKSHWKYPEDPDAISGLTPSLYTERDKTLIRNLITSDHWITEEGNNLKIMIETSNS